MSRNNTSQVAVLGMGIMGDAIAHNLEQDQLLAATWNRTVKKDCPKFTADIHAAVSSAHILLMLVTDDQAVNEVLDMIIPDLGKHHLLVQCSTVKPQSNISFHKRVEKTGARFIEALIGGSKDAAINRKIIFYTGGNRNDVSIAEPVLEKISAKCIYVGETGKASYIKLAMNLNIALQVEALCESFAYAKRAGIDKETFFTVLKNNTAWNRLSEYKEVKLKEMDFSPQFSVKNMHKDVRLALETDGTDKRLSLLIELEHIFSCAENAGLAEDDMVALYKLLEK